MAKDIDVEDQEQEQEETKVVATHDVAITVLSEKVGQDANGKEVVEKVETTYPLKMDEKKGDRAMKGVYPIYFQPQEVQTIPQLEEFIGAERAEKFEKDAISGLFKALSKSTDDAVTIDASYVAKKFQNFINEVRTRQVNPLVAAQNAFVAARDSYKKLKEQYSANATNAKWLNEVYKPAQAAAIKAREVLQAEQAKITAQLSEDLG